MANDDGGGTMGGSGGSGRTGGGGGGGTWLVLSVSASWVCVAQMARAAERQTESLQRSSVVPLMTCANTSAWMSLAVPYVLRRRRAPRSPPGGGTGGNRGLAALLATDAFGAWQPPRFLAIAVATNFCYIAALHFLPASLNTAIFCTNPIFTLLLSAVWLPQDVSGAETSAGQGGSLGRWCAALCSEWSLSVLLSVAGVLLIAEPWRHASPPNFGGQGGGEEEDSLWIRLAGACLSLFAAFGTAAYQVYFKVTFGGRLKPDEVGLFLARMGALALPVLGGACAALLASGVYSLQLNLVPWALVLATAASSALFNFLIKFGISVDSPMAMSLATQIGIPLNLLLDVAVVHADIDILQALGALSMLVSFTLQQQRGGGAPGGVRCPCPGASSQGGGASAGDHAPGSLRAGLLGCRKAVAAA